MSSLEIGDAEAAAVQKTPHRVALADIEAAIAAEFHGTAHDFAHGATVARPGKTFTISPELEVPVILDQLKNLSLCVLVLRNGFTVTGKSAPADPANFDAELGRKFAREDAVRQLWPLMGFALRDRLHTDARPLPETDEGPQPPRHPHPDHASPEPKPGRDFDEIGKPDGYANGIPHRKRDNLPETDGETMRGHPLKSQD